MQAAIWMIGLTDARRSSRARSEAPQRGWNRQRPERQLQRVAVAQVLHQPGLEHRLRQLFDIERHAVGPIDDLFRDFEGQRLPLRHPVNQFCPVFSTQALHVQPKDMRLVGPGRLVLGLLGSVRPVGDDQKNPSAAIRDTSTFNASWLVGSIQWTSSNTIKTGRCRASIST